MVKPVGQVGLDRGELGVAADRHGRALIGRSGSRAVRRRRTPTGWYCSTRVWVTEHTAVMVAVCRGHAVAATPAALPTPAVTPRVRDDPDLASLPATVTTIQAQRQPARDQPERLPNLWGSKTLPAAVGWASTRLVRTR
jgi:hypothetical protein